MSISIGWAKRIRQTERILLAVGLVLLTAWVAARVHGAVGSKLGVARFEALNKTNPSGHAFTLRDPALGLPIDFRRWSPQRIAAYEDSLSKKQDVPLAILRISKINTEAPIFNGTDDLTLNRGVGRILGTAHIGEAGNLGIAGHRDGFFRGLQRIAMGDTLELLVPGHLDRYTVSQIQIVTPEETSVLNPTAVPTLTLVTCFPFYFVGHAPKRYIVTAVFQSTRQSDSGAGEEAISTVSDKNKEEKK